MQRLPNYRNGSVVNLMSSLLEACDGVPHAVSAPGDDAPYAPLPWLDVSKLRDSRNIVLLVIDGLGHDYLSRNALGSRLQQHLAGKLDSVFPPTTAAAITTFMTGMAPQQHGLTGWFTYFRELGDVLAVLPLKSRHGASLGSDGPLDCNTLFHHESVFDRLGRVSYSVSPGFIAHSPFNLSHSGRANVRAYKGLSHCFWRIEQILKESKQHKFVYAYWPELDSLAHAHGIGSHQVAMHFALVDQAFGRFLSAIAGTETSVIVTADHGFIDTDASRCVILADHPELERMLVLPLCGEPRTAYCYLHPGTAHDFEAYVSSELHLQAQLVRSQALIDEGYFGLGKAHPRLAERVGHYTLLLKDNYTIKDWVLGEQPFTHLGVHGGLSDRELEVPLVLVEV